MASRSMSVRNNLPNKAEVSQALAIGLSRAIRTAGGKGSLADGMDTSTKTLDRALTGETLPELHTALAATQTDLTALDEVFKLYGFHASLNRVEAANDMELAASMSSTVTEFLKRLSDGKRCHIDTGVLAELFRRLIPQMQALVDEHDARVAA
jgi:DNA-binding phage protein